MKGGGKGAPQQIVECAGGLRPEDLCAGFFDDKALNKSSFVFTRKGEKSAIRTAKGRISSGT